jgi:hypothetical protein
VYVCNLKNRNYTNVVCFQFTNLFLSLSLRDSNKSKTFSAVGAIEAEEFVADERKLIFKI